MVQMKLPLLFQVADNARAIVNDVQTDDGATLEDIEDVKDVYDWILALHGEVGSTDWVSLHNYLTFTDALVADGNPGPLHHVHSAADDFISQRTSCCSNTQHM